MKRFSLLSSLFALLLAGIANAHPALALTYKYVGRLGAVTECQSHFNYGARPASTVQSPAQQFQGRPARPVRTLLSSV
ncbi:hypothetical protein [Bradyrhizobium cajani]|uniref:hypothetical protein n=1 Tax=Bradyrhizobium cajani TaxID=1928661 RepID=UPI00142EDAE4|nr:hypothetical protein [Bradyrhizobium cajani]MCP3368645.1 hypothetical protein [Bradyrhizobium cajani]